MATPTVLPIERKNVEDAVAMPMYLCGAAFWTATV